jgi:polyhydroxyalkanoate synthesis regulator phasin
MSAPLGLVVLTRDRIQDAVDEAVERGRMTRADANDLVEELLRCGRTQSDEIFADLERLASGAAGAAARTGHRAAASARRAPQADRVLREVDRVRRAAGLGQTFPIVGYDDLTAAQVNQRLGDLSAAELRKVRDHERRHANRKTVLSAVESKLA